MPPLISVSSGGGGVHVTITPPIDFIARQYGEFRRGLDDLMELWARFAPLMVEIETEQFASRGHGAWPPLAESTIRDKLGHGFPLDPLVRTGRLRESLINPGQAMTASPRLMTWGTDVDYAGYHQSGTSRMPMREVISIGVDERRRLEQAMVAWINDVAAEAFGELAA